MYNHHKFYRGLLFVILILGLSLSSLIVVHAKAIHSRANSPLNTYSTVNNHALNLNQLRTKPGSYHHEIIYSKYGTQVTFKTLAFVPWKMGGRGYFVQSFNVTPNSRFAYIGYDHNPALKKVMEILKLLNLI